MEGGRCEEAREYYREVFFRSALECVDIEVQSYPKILMSLSCSETSRASHKLVGVGLMC